MNRTTLCTGLPGRGIGPFALVIAGFFQGHRKDQATHDEQNDRVHVCGPGALDVGYPGQDQQHGDAGAR